MVSVRLSEEEYSALRELCSVRGERSVSDLTRTAMRALIAEGSGDTGSIPHLDELRSHFRNLDRKIEELAGKIAGTKSESRVES